MLYKLLQPDFKHIDSRGGLIQLVNKGYQQINYIFSVRDAVRGKHYHKLNNEAFYIIKGVVQVYLKDIRSGVQDTIDVETGDMFLIPPYVLHTFRYIEDTELVSMYDIGVELGIGEMDIYKQN